MVKGLGMIEMGLQIAQMKRSCLEFELYVILSTAALRGL
jgi:hypothetical protein